MRDSVERFLATLEAERGFSGNTVSAYRNDLTQFTRFLQSELGMQTWAELAETHLTSYLLSLREREYASSTIARKTAAIKSFCAYMVDVGELRGDPSEAVASPRVEKYVPKAMTESQVDALLSAPSSKSGPEGVRDRAMLHVLYSTGMRVSELVSLNLDDVTLEEGTVCCTGKQGRRREVPLSMEAIAALQGYLAGAHERLARGADEPALFLNHRGRRLTRQGFWLILKEYADGIGNSDVTPHTLRHSFAAHAIGRGDELGDVQRILGHVSIATTQVYTRIATSLRQAGEATDGQIESRELAGLAEVGAEP
jgi:integrase/recombinase XerD